MDLISSFNPKPVQKCVYTTKVCLNIDGYRTRYDLVIFYVVFSMQVTGILYHRPRDTHDVCCKVWTTVPLVVYLTIWHMIRTSRNTGMWYRYYDNIYRYFLYRFLVYRYAEGIHAQGGLMPASTHVYEMAWCCVPGSGWANSQPNSYHHTIHLPPAHHTKK